MLCVYACKRVVMTYPVPMMCMFPFIKHVAKPSNDLDAAPQSTALHPAPAPGRHWHRNKSSSCPAGLTSDTPLQRIQNPKKPNAGRAPGLLAPHLDSHYHQRPPREPLHTPTTLAPIHSDRVRHWPLLRRAWQIYNWKSTPGLARRRGARAPPPQCTITPPKEYPPVRPPQECALCTASTCLRRPKSSVVIGLQRSRTTSSQQHPSLEIAPFHSGPTPCITPDNAASPLTHPPDAGIELFHPSRPLSESLHRDRVGRGRQQRRSTTARRCSGFQNEPSWRIRAACVSCLPMVPGWLHA